MGAVYENKVKPTEKVTDDESMVAFLTKEGRLPADSPIAFDDILSKCPPGTKPVDLVRIMAKRRDVFRQDPTGLQFCVKPKVLCRDWAAVNPYLDPSNPTAACMMAAPVTETWTEG